MNKMAACSFVWRRPVRIVVKIMPGNGKEFFCFTQRNVNSGPVKLDLSNEQMY